MKVVAREQKKFIFLVAILKKIKKRINNMTKKKGLDIEDIRDWHIGG